MQRHLQTPRRTQLGSSLIGILITAKSQQSTKKTDVAILHIKRIQQNSAQPRKWLCPLQVLCSNAFFLAESVLVHAHLSVALLTIAPDHIQKCALLFCFESCAGHGPEDRQDFGRYAPIRPVELTRRFAL